MCVLNVFFLYIKVLWKAEKDQQERVKGGYLLLALNLATTAKVITLSLGCSKCYFFFVLCRLDVVKAIREYSMGGRECILCVFALWSCGAAEIFPPCQQLLCEAARIFSPYQRTNNYL